MKLLGLVISLLLSCAPVFAQQHRPPTVDTFNPQMAAADLEVIRNHISQLENKIVFYQMIGSLPSQLTGVVVASMGAIDLYSIVSASQADLYVIRQAERLEQGAVGLGFQAAERGGRLGALVLLPTKVAKFFSDLGVLAFEKGSQILIINSKILAGGATLSGVTWYFFSLGIVPSLIKYNKVELNMLKAYAASIAEEQENLSTPAPPKK